MFERLPLLLGTLTVVACDAAPPEPTDRVGLVASERIDDYTFYAFEASDASESECAVVLLDDVGSVLVVGHDAVVGTCDGSSCELELAAEDATQQACGQTPDALVGHARALAEEGTEFRDWCPPSEQSCGDDGGYGCISPNCKTACIRALQRCVARCDGDQGCIDACGDAGECLASCCG